MDHDLAVVVLLFGCFWVSVSGDSCRVRRTSGWNAITFSSEKMELLVESSVDVCCLDSVTSSLRGRLDIFLPLHVFQTLL